MATEDYDSDYEEAECPTCGAAIPADASECPECGQVFEEEEEEELWETEEEGVIEEAPEEEREEEWEGYWEEESAPKLKLYAGVILVLIGGIGLGFMSWFHNQIGLFPFGIGSYTGYGPYDQITGGSGTVITLIGILLIYLWTRDVKEFEERKEIPEEAKLEEEEYFAETGPEEEVVEEEVVEEEYEEPEEEEYEELWEEEEAEEEEAEEEEAEEEEMETECPNCGATVSADAIECPECGEILDEDLMFEEEEEEGEEQIRCPNCGTMNDPDADFCDNCEQDLSGGTEIWSDE